MSSTSAVPSPALFFDTVNAYQRTAALKAAIELGLFSALALGARTPNELAHCCSASERGLRILCDFLTVVGFFEKEGGAYRLTRDSELFLDSNSPGYVGGAIRYLLNPVITSAFENVAAAVRIGGTATTDARALAPEHEVWTEFAKSMTGSMTVLSRLLPAVLRLNRDVSLKVLDVAAGHGMFGIAVGRICPQAEIVAIDSANVLTVARENAAQAGLNGRYKTIEGDALEVSLGDGYDLVLLTNVMHLFDRKTGLRLLSKVHASLKEGGQAVLIDFIPNEDRVSPPAAASFSLMMLTTTPGGEAHTFKDYQFMFNEAGFSNVSLQSLSPSDHRAVVALKESKESQNTRKVEIVPVTRRIPRNEALALLENEPLLSLGEKAFEVKRGLHGDRITFVNNLHINPTNLCVFSCRFCDFAAKKGDPHAYELTEESILKQFEDPHIHEAHIVGGLWPTWGYGRSLNLVRGIRRARPDVWIKAFTAVEVKYFAKMEHRDTVSILSEMVEAGVDMLPGGGAEVLNDRIHRELYMDKIGPDEWLEIHDEAHQLGIPTNATLLFGHIETDEEIVDHLIRLRELQDKSPGFRSFIPLAYQPGKTGLVTRLVSAPRCLRVIALSRLLLDNIPHIKAYWPTLQVETAVAALNFGADDLDGTLGRERIMQLAGTESPAQVSSDFMREMVFQAGQQPAERGGSHEVLSTHHELTGV